MKLISEDEPASKKFWAFEERINSDKRTPGVQLILKKSKIDWDLARLMNDGVITAADLEGFSEELKKYVLERADFFSDKD